MRKYIMVASSKGGIGKSTTAIGLAHALCESGKKVLICDLDYGNACLDMLLGCEDRILYTSADVADENCAPDDAIIRPFDEKELFLLPAPGGGETYISDIAEGSENSGNATSLTSLKDAITSAAEAVGADFVILDTGAGVNNGATLAASICSLALIVASHSPVSIRSAESTAARLSKYGVGKSLLIINSFDADGVLLKKSGARSSIFTIIDSCRVQLCGIVPYDYDLSLYQEGTKTKPAISNIAYKNIADRLLGKNVPLFTGMKRHRKLRTKFYN